MNYHFVAHIANETVYAFTLSMASVVHVLSPRGIPEKKMP